MELLGVNRYIVPPWKDGDLICEETGDQIETLKRTDFIPSETLDQRHYGSSSSTLRLVGNGITAHRLKGWFLTRSW